jgi:putative transposase
MGKHNYWEKLLPDHCYHIYNHAVGIENLFKVPRNYIYFLEKWDKYISPYFANYAFCLMPNHFHFLCKAKPISEELKIKIAEDGTKRGLAFLAGEVPVNVFYESQFASFFKSYTQAINKQEVNRFGGLFKAKFRRTLVSNREELMYYLCYIHHNPIHHDMAADYNGWENTSYHIYLEQVSDTFKVSDTSKPKLSISSTLKLFISEEDSFGLDGFRKEHQRFKKDFTRKEKN